MKLLYLALFSLIISLLFSNCVEQQAKEIPTFILMERLAATQSIIYDEEGYRQAMFHPIYIGEYKDTINYKTVSEENYSITERFSCGNEEDSCIINYGELDIIVDTSQVIEYFGLEPFFIPPPDSNFDIDAKIDSLRATVIPIWSYPVIIKNDSDTAQYIGSGGFAIFRIEVFQDGEWTEKQRPARGCGMSPRYYVSPHSIYVTNMPIFQNWAGEKVRLELFEDFSNEFTMGNIDSLLELREE